MGIESGSITIEGREYITTKEYARRYKRDPSGLREAARKNRCGLGDERRLVLDTMVYPVDRIDQWREVAAASGWARGRGQTDISKIAHRYDLDRMMVQRALNAKRLEGYQDEKGIWRISADDAAAWARDWLGILEPVNPDK